MFVCPTFFFYVIAFLSGREWQLAVLNATQQKEFDRSVFVCSVAGVTRRYRQTRTVTVFVVFLQMASKKRQPELGDLPLGSLPPLGDEFVPPAEPPPPYAPQYNPPVVSVQPNSAPQPVVLVVISWGTEPQEVQCPYCRKMVVSVVKKKVFTFSCCYTAVCCVVLFFVGCLLIPRRCYCQRFIHYCPECNKRLGTHEQ